MFAVWFLANVSFAIDENFSLKSPGRLQLYYSLFFVWEVITSDSDVTLHTGNYFNIIETINWKFCVSFILYSFYISFFSIFIS